MTFKKTLAVLTVLLMLCCILTVPLTTRKAESVQPCEEHEIWDGSIAESFAGGNGTEESPYLISTGSELAYLAQQTNNRSLSEDMYFKMSADIYINDIENWENWKTQPPSNEWTPIGIIDSSYDDPFFPFLGHFNGAGFKVFGIYINNPESGNQGLFGYNYGTISNVGVEASYIYGTECIGAVAAENIYGGTVADCYNAGTVCGQFENIGGIVGGNSNGAVVSDCRNFGTVNGELYDPDNGLYNIYIGGIVGNNFDGGYITDCHNEGFVTGSQLVGGIAGFNSEKIDLCYNSGTVNGNDYGAGGVTGGNGDEAAMMNCYNIGAVNGCDMVGGVAGYNYGASKICYNAGAVNGIQNVGGITGYNYSKLTACYNTGTVSGEEKVGGAAGTNKYNGTVIDCYNTASVNGNEKIGGVLGYNASSGKAFNCYNIGTVSGETEIGGAIGFSEGQSETIYYLDTCCAQGDLYALPLTEPQMKEAESFVGFDFEKTWTMEGDSSYPYPELDVKYKITFIDGHTYEEIPGGYFVLPGEILDESEFPVPPTHEGCEFLGWKYNTEPVYDDCIIKAIYYDSDSVELNGYMILNQTWISFPEYDPEEITVKDYMEQTLAAAYAGGNIYGFLNTFDWSTGEPDNRFYIINAETFEITYPGFNPQDKTVFAMAYDHAGGEMYALARNQNGDIGLYTVNLALGFLNFVAPVDANNTEIVTLAIDSDGNAYGLGSSNTDSCLYSVNLADGCCTVIGNTGVDFVYAQSMTWDHNTGRLFWACNSGDGNSSLYIVEPETAEVICCGKIGSGEVTGLWTANDEPVAPITEPDFTITFVDGLTGEEIPGGFTVPGGNVLDETTFPEPPDHEIDGYEFIGWDYAGDIIIDDTVITALYRDVNLIGFYFETNPETEGWTWEDCDGDGYNWNWMYDTGLITPEGCGAMNSESYNDNYGELSPDNWLISPEVPGGGSVSFMFVAQDSYYSDEPIGVYVSADGGETWSEELGYFMAAAEVRTGTVSLSDFSGQDVRIAFRHYDVTAMLSVSIDAVEVTPDETTVTPTEEPPTEEPPTEAPPTEEPPTEEPPTEEPPTETPTEPPAPPVTGFASLAGAGIAAILAGAGVVLFRRKRS